MLRDMTVDNIRQDEFMFEPELPSQIRQIAEDGEGGFGDIIG